MKTRINQLTVALFFAIFFVAGNVNATEHDVKASSHENIEATLEFENWMMDENVWNTSTFHYAKAAEANLEIENWMINKFVWDVQFDSFTIENWMVNENIWEVESAEVIETETEQELTTESWMIDEDIWKM
jgi:hypothetical protein